MESETKVSVEVHALVATDKATKEQFVPLVRSAAGGLIPLVTGEAKRVEWLRELGRKFTDREGLPCRLVSFTANAVIEEFEP